MKKNTKVYLLLLILIFLAVSDLPSWAREEANIAMILWRGMTEAEDGFQTKLKQSEKYDINFTIFNANQNEKELERIIDQLDHRKYKVIYSFGTTVTETLKRKIKSTPIVFNIVARPIEAKIINSWEHSGNNITGASNAVPMSSAFNTLSTVLYIDRLGILFNPKEANAVIQKEEVEKLQKEFRYELVSSPIENVENIQNAIQKLVDEKVDAVLLPSDSLIKANANAIVSVLNKNKIPTIASIPDMVKDNKAFIGLGPDYYDLGIMAANKALAILGGEKPNNVPSSPLERLHITVNLTTAKEIGVNIPIQILRISTVVR
ncbi:MAG: ABC transporter substrate-binding protein [Candidatus Tectomicrobia bacterium]|uniref:ABC transporter substrate-binding protein n=1 Tax=Tectimicrobiota bacterium TaxID=2528274 RepID=A0A933GPG2_UNCTE|nr:ABC transporter substrate-binding protein [Candidatus Tectomicrobia bacterium]